MVILYGFHNPPPEVNSPCKERKDDRMKTRTNFLRALSWMMALAMVFSLAAVPAAAEEGTYSAELVISSEGVEMSGKLVVDTTQVLLGIVAGLRSEGQSLLDAAAYLGPQVWAVDSALIGGAYGVDLTTLAENLPNSIFAPDSGSAYALDQDSYDQFMAILTNVSAGFPETVAGDDSAIQEAAMILAAALAEPLSQAAANLAMSTEPAVETINGSSIDVTRMVIAADGEAIVGFLDAVITTLQGNPQAQNALAVILDYLNASGNDLGASGTEIVQMLVEQGDQVLQEAQAGLAEMAVSGSVSLSDATQAPVKLSLAIQAEGEEMTFNILIGEAMDFFRLEMLDNGEVGPAAQLTLVEESQDVRTIKLSLLDGDAEAVSLALTVDRSAQTFLVTLFAEGETSTASGTYIMEEDLMSFTLDKLDGQEFGGTATLNLRGSDNLTLPAFSEITAMTEEEFTALVELVSQTVETYSQMFA